MKYKVHRLDVDKETMQNKLELLLNSLDGEVVAVMPNVRPTFLAYGATAKVDYLLVAEKIKANRRERKPRPKKR